jgi:hypothetical protein
MAITFRRDSHATPSAATSVSGTGGVRCITVVLLTLVASPLHAATVTLDTTLPGADVDAVLDGFPGLAAHDGVADFGGNALAVALKQGVTEERALVELPLAPLVAAGGTATSVVGATLTFNVDDVLTTFGPGTDFDATAAERIHVAVYSGNGTVDLADYAAGTHADTVTTGPHGAITDASVRDGGPVVFTLDLTPEVKALLQAGATHVGLVFSTDDSPTGTSIDDLGDGGGGPPGARGARMPYLTVEVVEATPVPTPSPTPSPAPSTGPTASPVPTATPQPTSGATPSPAASVTPAPTSSGDPGPTPSPAEPTPTAGQGTPQPTASGAATPTAGSSVTPSPAATATPSATQSAATPTPRATGALEPTPTPRPITTPPRPTAPSQPTPTAARAASEQPDGSGDQLVFFYDARDGFTTFLNLHNLGDTGLEVQLDLYGPDLGDAVRETFPLAAGATRTVDVGLLRTRGVPASAGAAFATAVDESGAAVVSRALGGSFTVANLATGSAWGAAAAARRAITASDPATAPAPGARIDGSAIRLRELRPRHVALPVFYDPATLEPAELGGNQLLLLSFDDLAGAVPTAATTTWTLDARRSNGERLAANPVSATGVLVTHLDEVLGDDARGAAGSITFSASGGAGNRLVFFTESLGTFATGYLLPPVAHQE